MQGLKLNANGLLSGAPRKGRKSARAISAGACGGTLIGTEDGWQPVDALAPGDMVWTFDDGLQPLLKLKTAIAAGQVATLISIPAGALGNEEDILCPGTLGLLLECENGCDPAGEPYAVIPAAALVGLCGISLREVSNPGPVFRPVFSAEQAVYMDGGLLMHCGAAHGHAAPARYDVKPVSSAQDFLTDLDIAELALREPYEDFIDERAFEPA